MQTILDSITFCGCIVDDAVFIVGFVMGKQEGKSLNGLEMKVPLMSFAFCIMNFDGLLSSAIIPRLNNEQRAAIADYFRVYKVCYCWIQ